MQSIEQVALVLFCVTIVIFHTSEVLLVFCIEPEELTPNSALLSPPYLIAMGCGLAEYLARQKLVPQYAIWRLSVGVGMVMIIVGESLRKAAWLTAGTSFTHLIKFRRRSEHELVTNGVYSIVRHPGYLGWMIWAVGTQVLLSNIICSIGFTIVAWRFFRERIEIEESYLISMFGDRYEQYRKSVPTRIPGIP